MLILSLTIGTMAGLWLIWREGIRDTPYYTGWALILVCASVIFLAYGLAIYANAGVSATNVL